MLGLRIKNNNKFTYMIRVLIDAHAHLTDDDYSGLEYYMVNMLRALGMRAISVSMDMNTSERNLRFAECYSDVIIPFVGLHPWCVDRENLDSFVQFITSNIDKIMGIGEIGLDGTYTTNYSRQREVFESMLSIAERYRKPISVHSRRALDDVLNILSSYDIKGVLLHWFSGSKRQLAKANELGYYISYGPVLVYSEEKRALLRNSDTDLVLLETDGPVRYGSCFNQSMAVPSFLISVAYAFADTLKMEYDHAEEVLLNNTLRYLGS
jgi:TatD DNase family protein